MVTFTVEQALGSIGLKVLIYGPAGAGKTTIARTMPKPVLVLDFEGGILALMGEPEVLVCPVRSTQELLQAASELASDTQFKSVVFDGLSIYVRRRIQELRGSKERATWDDWQKLTNEVRSAVLPLLQLRKHLLLTSLPKWIRQRDERGRETSQIIGATPALTPALISDLVAACDLVGYLVGPNDPLFQDTQERFVLFAPVDGLRITTKSRLPRINRAEPNFSKWLDIAALPDLVTTESNISIGVPIELEVTQADSAQQSPKTPPTKPAQSAETPEPAEVSDELTKQIFSIGKQLGLDPKALGRIARQYFGEGYIKKLTDDQKRQLISLMQQKLKRSEADVEVDRFIEAWRSVRGYPDEFPFERELAAIAVERDWQIDELEGAVLEALLDRGFEIASLPTDRFWLATVDEGLLREVVEELKAARQVA